MLSKHEKRDEALVDIESRTGDDDHEAGNADEDMVALIQKQNDPERLIALTTMPNRRLYAMATTFAVGEEAC